MKKKTWIAWIAVLLIGSLLLAGCAYPDDGKPYATAAPTEETTKPTEETLPIDEETTEAPTEAPTEEPTEEPTEPEIDALTEQALALLAELTTEEKVAQLFIVTPETLTGINTAVVRAGNATKEAFDDYPVGGIIYFADNLETPKQTQEMLENMQRFSSERMGVPLLLAVDEEGGTVARISGNPDFGITLYPNAAEVTDEAEARRIGEEMGAYLAELGFNVNFAPDADVLTVANNEVMRLRSFGSDSDRVTALCAAFSEGLASQGVLPCYKHFPGLGSAVTDLHDGTASSRRSLEELFVNEFAPFLDAAERGMPMIMVSHIKLPKVSTDGLPASLSHEIVTGLLREELAFEGVIVTDALNMGAITQEYAVDEAAVMAFEAGADMLLLTGGFREAYEAVLAAVQDGRISPERLDESLLRILRMKLAEE